MERLFKLVAVMALMTVTRCSRTEADLPEMLIRNIPVRLASSASHGEASTDRDVEYDNYPGLDSLGPDLAKHQSTEGQSEIEGMSFEDLEQLIREHGMDNVRLRGGYSLRFMLEMYRRLEDGAELPQAAGYTNVDAAILRADTVRSLSASESEKNEKEGSKKVTLTFNLTSISHREITERAELRVRPLRTRSHNAGIEGMQFRARVTIFSSGVSVKRMTYHVTAEEETTDGFAVLDLTPIIKEAVDAGYKNASVEIRLKQQSVRVSARRQRRSVRHVDISSVAKDAMLVVFTKDKHFFENFREKATKRYLKTLLSTSQSRSVADMSHVFSADSSLRHRSKRRSNTRRTKPDNSVCEKQDLIIDFDQIGWGEWIIYPKKFNAFQCSGKCPLPVTHEYDPTNHALLQSLMRIRDSKVTSRPCCVPSKLKAMSMLYIEDDEIVVRRHKDMVVDKCGCR